MTATAAGVLTVADAVAVAVLLLMVVMLGAGLVTNAVRWFRSRV